MSELTTKQYLSKLKRQFAEIKKINKPMALGAAAAHSEYIPRIFEKGLNEDRQKIGSRYSPSYKKLRQKKGRQTSFVDLKFSGKLFTDAANGLTKKKPFLWVVQLKRQINVIKANSIKDMYGEVFDLTKKEKSIYLKTVQKEYTKILRK